MPSLLQTFKANGLADNISLMINNYKYINNRVYTTRNDGSMYHVMLQRSIHLFTHRSTVHPFIHQSIYLSIYPSNHCNQFSMINMYNRAIYCYKLAVVRVSINIYIQHTKLIYLSFHLSTTIHPSIHTYIQHIDKFSSIHSIH